MNLTNAYLQKGIKYLDTITEKELVNLIKYVNDAYYNEDAIMTDTEYDILREYIETHYPMNPILQKVGSLPSYKKVKLPVSMPSMNKIKPEKLERWIMKYPPFTEESSYIISYKLDGVSALYIANEQKLFTRGDGLYGQDISHILPYLSINMNYFQSRILIRGELIMSKKNFLKYKDRFANARNMIPGLLRQKDIEPNIWKDIDFIAYEYITDINYYNHGLIDLKDMGFNVVEWTTSKNITNTFLSSILENARKNYEYEIDGLIVSHNKKYQRIIDKCINPEHAFAFKTLSTEQLAETKVLNVIWNISKDGYLKPRVQIEPIMIGGVRIEYITGKNAGFIRDNKIGFGAIVQIVRSGEVIPNISKVIFPAKIGQFPEVSYSWNDTGVDIYVENKEHNLEVKIRRITLFFQTLEVEGLSEGNIRRIINTGYNSIPKILSMNITDFLRVDGFQEKIANKLYNGIRVKLENATLPLLMTASNAFGRGFNHKRFELILQYYPEVLSSTDIIYNRECLLKIPGIAEQTAEAFMQGIPGFLKFLEEIGQTKKLLNISNSKEVVCSSLEGKTIILTGFRDKELENKIIENGGKIGSSVSGNTFMVLIKSTEENMIITGKIADAKKRNIPIMNVKDFMKIYL